MMDYKSQSMHVKYSNKKQSPFQLSTQIAHQNHLTYVYYRLDDASKSARSCSISSSKQDMDFNRKYFQRRVRDDPVNYLEH